MKNQFDSFQLRHYHSERMQRTWMFTSQTKDLERLDEDADFTAGLSRAIVKSFRKRMQQIRAAPDERVFYELKGLHFEKLKGKRSHERSMMLNKQFRLILELQGKGSNRRVLVRGIEDYH